MMRRTMFWFLTCALMTLASAQALAQETKAPTQDALLQDYDLKRRQTNERGMAILLGWAALNMGVGAIGWARSEDPRWRAFHQMNLGWNVVNAAIAAFGYYDATRPQTLPLGLSETIAQGVSIQKILMINIGLDVAYMAAGAWMWERGRRLEDVRFEGWGQSLILQGGFLFAFDLGLVLVHQHHFDAFLPKLSVSPGQLAMSWGFSF